MDLIHDNMVINLLITTFPNYNMCQNVIYYYGLEITHSTHQKGFRIALHEGLVHRTGSYCIGGRSVLSLIGVSRHPSGITIRVASIRLDGHTFQLNLVPSRSSFC